MFNHKKYQAMSSARLHPAVVHQTEKPTEAEYLELVRAQLMKFFSGLAPHKPVQLGKRLDALWALLLYNCQVNPVIDQLLTKLMTKNPVTGPEATNQPLPDVENSKEAFFILSKRVSKTPLFRDGGDASLFVALLGRTGMALRRAKLAGVLNSEQFLARASLILQSLDTISLAVATDIRPRSEDLNELIEIAYGELGALGTLTDQAITRFVKGV